MAIAISVTTALLSFCSLILILGMPLIEEGSTESVRNDARGVCSFFVGAGVIFSSVLVGEITYVIAMFMVKCFS